MKARAIKQTGGPSHNEAPERAFSGLAPLQAKSKTFSSAKDGEERYVTHPGGLSGSGAGFGDVEVFPQRSLADSGKSGVPLPGQLRQRMEAAFGADFSDVRVHQGPDADSLSARAFTQGRDIHFAPGQYNPSTGEGQKVIAHELTHVVQQRQGRVATPSTAGAPVNADPALESEADVLGERAARSEATKVPAAASQARAATGPSNIAPVQGILPRVGMALAGTGAWMGRNLQQQRRALEDEESVDPSSRLGAMLATRNFESGTVGYGAHAGIRGIHLAMGNIGQSNIGDLFRSQQAQELMGQPIDSPANQQLGAMEYNLWQQRYEGQGANGPATLGERFGGLAGTRFSQETRAGIQEELSDLRDRM